MKHLLSTLFFLVVFIVTSFSQFTQEWDARFHDVSNNPIGSSRIAKDSQGKIYVSGQINRLAYLLIKYDTDGSELWSRTFPGRSTSNPSSIACCLAIDANDNVVISGEYSKNNMFAVDDAILTIKYNSNGDVIWAYTYDDPNYSAYKQWGRDMVMDANGNVYVCGLGGFTNGGKGVIIKISPDGDLIWDRFIQEDGDASSLIDLYHIGIDGSGNVYVGGRRIWQNQEYMIVAKYDSDGNQQWIDKYTGSESINVNGMSVNSSGDLFFAGGSANGNYLILKYNTSGTRQWAAEYNGTANNTDLASSVICDAGGNVYVTGQSAENGLTAIVQVVTTVKFNSKGTQLWSDSYISGSLFSSGCSITLDNSGNAYINGYQMSNGNAHSKDFLLLKYTPNNSRTSITYDNGGEDGHGDWMDPIIVDNSGNVFVSFESETPQGGNTYDPDNATVKFSQSGDGSLTAGRVNYMLNNYSLSQNYPNPFNPSTIIHFDLAKSGFVTLAVFDVLGRQVDILLSKNMEAGSHTVSFDGSSLAAGIYFYKLETSQFSETRKMMLVK